MRASIWRDRGRGKYYIGSHWGDPDDGYVSSGQEMMREWRHRPGHFRRRILATVTDPNELKAEENRWLEMIRRKRGRYRSYYNKTRGVPLKKSSAQIVLYIEPAAHMQLKLCAIEEGVKVHDLLLEAIQEWMDQKGIDEQARA
jgi:hypothetical protein